MNGIFGCILILFYNKASIEQPVVKLGTF